MRLSSGFDDPVASSVSRFSVRQIDVRPTRDRVADRAGRNRTNDTRIFSLMSVAACYWTAARRGYRSKSA